MPMKIGTEMPALDGATEWFNATGARAAAEAEGHPTLVHFWSASCETCKASLARISSLRDERRDSGLRVIAIHSPRDESDTDVETVRDALTTCGLEEPCAVDNRHAIGDAFEHERGQLPAFYLFDAEGRLAAFAHGAQGLGEVESALNRLLDDSPASSQ